MLENRALTAQVAVWRAAHHVPDTDLRPTGPGRYPAAERHHQQHLDTRIIDTLGDLHTATHTWAPLAKRIDIRLTTDPWWPVLAQHLDTAAEAGHDIEALLTTAAHQRPLPDDMPAAALWHRLDLSDRAPIEDAQASVGEPDDNSVVSSAGSAIDAAVASALPYDTADLIYETDPNGEDQRHGPAPVAESARPPATDLGL